MINELRSMRWLIPIATFAAVAAVNYAPAFGQDIQYREDPNAEGLGSKANAARAHARGASRKILCH
jgi:hypothetical protein